MALLLGAWAFAVASSTAGANPSGYWANWHAYHVASISFIATSADVKYDPDTQKVAFRDSQATTIRLRPNATTTFGYNGNITAPISGRTSGRQESFYTEGSSAGSLNGACAYHFEFKGSDSLQIDFTHRGGDVETSFIPVISEGGYCDKTTEDEATSWYLPRQVAFATSRFSSNTIVLHTGGAYEAGRGSKLEHARYTWSLTVTITDH